MGNDKNVKQLRGQIRQIVKEMYPEIITSEIFATLQTQTKERMDVLHRLVKESLDRIDQRQKDVQSLLMRELIASNSPIPPQEQKTVEDEPKAQE
jgi:hypothetical protein